MLRKNWLIIFLFLLVLFPGNVLSASAVLSIDRNVVTINETFELSIKITDTSGRVDFPEVPGLKVLSKGQSSRTSIVNGRVEAELNYIYTMVAYKDGIVTIPEIDIKTKNGIIKTNSLEIKVEKDDVQKAVPGQSSIFTKVVLSDPSPFISEKIQYKIIVYSNDSVLRIGFNEPEFKNFMAKRIDDKNYRKVIAGREYRVSEIIYDLTPVKEGKGVIPPAEIEAQIVVEKKGKSTDPFFNDPFFRASRSTKRKILLSQEAEYEIRKLPETELKSFFTNIVGKIRGYSSIDKKDLKRDDFLNYKLVIEGVGNLSDLKLPELNFNNEFKVYKDDPVSEFVKTEKGESGSLSQAFAIVAPGAGEHLIPGFKLRFFDPDEEKWKEILINENKFNVSASASSSASSSGNSPGLSKNESPEKKEIIEKEEVKSNNEIIFIMENPYSLFSKKPDHKRFFLISICSFGLFCLGLFIKTKFSGVLNGLKNDKKTFIKRLDTIEKDMDKKEKASEIKQIINDFLRFEFNFSVDEFLTSSEIDNEIKNDFKKLMDALEVVQFSGEEVSMNFDKIINKSKKLIKRF